MDIKSTKVCCYFYKLTQSIPHLHPCTLPWSVAILQLMEMKCKGYRGGLYRELKIIKIKSSNFLLVLKCVNCSNISIIFSSSLRSSFLLNFILWNALKRKITKKPLRDSLAFSPSEVVSYHDCERPTFFATTVMHKYYGKIWSNWDCVYVTMQPHMHRNISKKNL